MTMRMVLLLVCIVGASAHAQDAALLQREIDLAIEKNEAPTLRLDGRTYYIETPIDFRGHFEGASIIGQGFNTVLQNRIDDRRQPMINLTGCTRATVRDLVIAGGPATNPLQRNVPSCGLLLARKTNGASAGDHVIERVWFRGRFALACIANVASEGNRIRDVEFSNHEGPSQVIDGLPHGGHLLYISNGDYHNWLATRTGMSTMQTLWLDDCKFQKSPVTDADKNGAAVMVYSRQAAVVSDLHFSGINAGIYQQRAVFAFDMPQAFDMATGRSLGGQTHMITIERSRFESETTEAFIKCGGGRSIAGLAVRDSEIYIADTAFDFGARAANVSLQNLRMIRRSGDVAESFYRAPMRLEQSGGRIDQIEQFGWRN
ncbi:MAG: hypothetical protein H6819_06640 [Phycisphaerales bacterium]|nr:hypothetical protein [Phycisphaerales bacterium]MCB9855258.1 hypothetical protein [Phycisphaerales bacterium]MCB9862851.1 hypothetical protein [Phycisphaerales bacterium]